MSLPALALVRPAHAERIPLDEISRYFNSFTTAEGEFTQINPDGTLSTGRIYIRRPRSGPVRIRPAGRLTCDGRWWAGRDFRWAVKSGGQASIS